MVVMVVGTVMVTVVGTVMVMVTVVVVIVVTVTVVVTVTAVVVVVVTVMVTVLVSSQRWGHGCLLPVLPPVPSTGSSLKDGKIDAHRRAGAGKVQAAAPGRPKTGESKPGSRHLLLQTQK
ncbi:Ras Gtpase-Activating-Like Protein Iqgap2 [Manis pentadactyla]|nr:Ras Gtpase-Activating-Like Protein Iqgap2 [Manis pentadactyla]